MIVFRAMCKEEADSVSDNTPLHFKRRWKWFGTESFVKSRVLDGKFNNSKYADKYSVLCKYEIISGLEYFSKCGHNEFMLDRRKAQNINIRLLSKELVNVNGRILKG